MRHGGEDAIERVVVMPTSFNSDLVVPALDRCPTSNSSPGAEAREPITWGTFFEHLRERTAQRRQRRHASFTLYYTPSWSLALNVAFGPGFAYLCWGIPKRGVRGRWARLMKLRLILRGARVLLVHDVVTQRWIRRFLGRDATVLPLPVDTTFFHPAPPQWTPSGHILVPGDNDRNEDYVAELAGRWPKVVRVAQDPLTRERYSRGAIAPNIVFEYRVPWERLRELYWNAAAVVLPTGGTTHAAGQQAMLESIACARPVFTDSPHLLSIGRRWGLPVHPLPRSPGHLAELLLRSSVAPARDGLGGLPRDFAIDAALERYLDVLAPGGTRERRCPVAER